MVYSWKVYPKHWVGTGKGEGGKRRNYGNQMGSGGFSWKDWLKTGKAGEANGEQECELGMLLIENLPLQPYESLLCLV